MNNKLDTLPPNDEAEALLIAMDRLFDFQDEKAAAKTGFEEYWAGSAAASVCRDYKAGRIKIVRA